jgi:hypothetical protein
LAPPIDRPYRGTSRATASNLDTHLDRGVGRRVRMLLSFQRPSHLSGRVVLPSGAPANRLRFPGRTDEYSAEDRIAKTPAPPRRNRRYIG